MFNLKSYFVVIVLIDCVFCQIGPPTQPTWTVDEVTEKKVVKVAVNLKNLLETASIRKEIESAISHHSYAIGGKDEDEIVHEADEELGQDFRNKNHKTLVGDTHDSASSSSKNPVLGDENDSPAIDWLQDIVPNKVASNLMSDDQPNNVFIPEYHAANYNPEVEGRDVLVLSRIEEDMNFNINKDIDTWKALKNGDLLGVSKSKLILAKRMHGDYQIADEIDLNEQIESLEAISAWNQTSQTLFNLAIVSLNSSIRWIAIDSMSTIWNWPIGSRIYCTRSFENGRSKYLVALTDAMVIVFQYDLITKEYFSTQTIVIERQTSQMEFLDAGYHKILAIPQHRQVVILQSDASSRAGQLHFKKMPSLPAKNVSTIHAFQTGGYSYLAVGGDQPSIYRYHYGTFMPQTILDSNFGFVDLFLAVPCPTYRDDLVLLVQHRIMFETHSINVLEPLIWNGLAFEATKSVPCKVGETIQLFGASCILDLEREEGLQGATVVTHQHQVLLVIPRFQASSGLFRFYTELNPRSSELEDLESMLQQMEAMVLDQEKIMDMLESRQWTLDKLHTNQLSFNGDVEHFLLNGQEWTEGDTEIDLEQLIQDIRNIHKQIDEAEQDLQVEQVDVEELYLENLNGQPFQDLKKIDYYGTIIIEGDLIADQLVQLPFKQLHGSDDDEVLEIVEIHGDLSFDLINGIAWEDLMEQIAFKDSPTELESVIVEKLLIDGDMKIDSLNGIRFPDDFLLSSGPKASKVTGKKEFSHVLNTNAMDCEETINNIHPLDFITLGHEQFIPGTTTFTQLEVTKSFEINGTISGKDLSHFVPNPTLLDTHIITPECQFKKLIVDGPVILKGLYNGMEFDDVLDDVIYTSDQNISITSAKTFREILLPDTNTLGSNSISGVDLDEFVTLSTNQDLSVTEIEGDLDIHNLKLMGLYNGVNVTEMEMNSIKLDEDRILNTTVIFKEPQLLQVNTLEILQSVNKIPVDQFTNIKEPIHLSNVIADELIIDELRTTCDIDGTGQLNGVDLEQFSKDRFSLSSNQTVTADIFADQVIIESDFNVQSINGLSVSNLSKDSIKSGDKYSAVRSAKHIKVLGNVEVKSINGQEAKKLWDQVIWLDRPNTIKVPVQFLDEVHFKKDVRLKSGLINNINLEEFVDDLVLKNKKDPAMIIKGEKKFTAPIEVLKDATIHSFNGIPANRLVTKFKPIKIEADLHVDGDLYIHSLDMSGERFGNYSVSDIFEMYQYDPNEDMHYISGEVHFSGDTAIERLRVGETINGQGNLDEMFKSLVFKNASTKVTGKKIFRNEVIFEQGIFVGMLNGVNVSQLLENVIYINGNEPVEINRPVVFQSPITAEHIFVEGDVHTSQMLGCELKEWLDNCLRTDRPIRVEDPIYLPAGFLDGNSLNIQSLNNVPMKDLITLHTPQNLSGDIYFPYVYLDGPLNVEGTVNNMDLVEQYRNTLMISGNQNITAPIETKTIHVIHRLETLQPINDRDLREVATVFDDIHLKSSLSFKNIVAKNIYTNDLISGLNFTDWYQNSLKFNVSSQQSITGVWSINELIVNTKSVSIKPPLTVGNGTDLLSTSKNLQENYASLCEEMTTLRQRVVERVSFLKYLKFDHAMIFEYGVDFMHPIIFADSSLILINQGCFSEVYLWDVEAHRFMSIAQMNTGQILRVDTLPDHSFVTLSERMSNLSKISVETLWKLQGKQVVLKGKPFLHSGSNHHTMHTANRYGRDTEDDMPDFNVPIVGIATKMLEDLRPFQDENSSFVTSAFGDKIKDVAKKLLIGLTQLDDVKTIIDHAHKIYHAVERSNDHAKGSHPAQQLEHEDDLHHDHKGHQDSHEHIHTLNDHLDFSDHSDTSKPTYDNPHDHSQHEGFEDEGVSAAVPPHLAVPPHAHPYLPDGVLTAVHRLETMLHAVPLGFGELIKSTSSSLNGSDFGSHIQNLVAGISKVFSTPQPINSTHHRKRDAEPERSVGHSMNLLRKYAETEFVHEDENEVPGESYLVDTDNSVEHYREAIGFEVGSPNNRRKMIAVISPSDLRSIRLYFHDLKGEAFQIIGTSSPSLLTAVEIKDETILAFVDGPSLIRVMKYKGVEGFIEWSTFQSSSGQPIVQLMSLSLAKDSSACRTYYLVSAHRNHIQFFEIVMGGMCSLKVTSGDCHSWW